MTQFASNACAALRKMVTFGNSKDASVKSSEYKDAIFSAKKI